MPRLLIVLRDLYPARLDRATRAGLPRLPALARWLAQGDAEQRSGDWRQWLWRELGGRERRPLPAAAIAAAAVPGLGADRPVWFATPVHFVAGLDTVRLHPSGLLELLADEQQALAADFGRVFAGSGHTLHPAGRRELLLAGGEMATASSVRSHDPAQWLGADPGAGLPAGEGAAALRRLGAELEMWLHEHPVNVARAARGLLTVNALWLWGGGAPAPAVVAGDPVGNEFVAWADDLFVDGLARLQGGEVRAPPARWPASMPGGITPQELLVVRALGAAPDARSLLALDSDWMAPALAQWQGGAFERATLLAGHSAYTLGRGRLRRLWRRFRRTRPWWETVLQC